MVGETIKCEKNEREGYVILLFCSEHAAGLITCAGLTSEEITAKRRAERKQFKLDRAKAIAAAAAEAETAFKEQGRVIAPGIAPDGTRIIPSAATWKPTSASAPSEQSPPDIATDEVQEEIEPIEDLEHLQLSLQEAFFLVWALDCLTVLHPETVRSLLPSSKPVHLTLHAE